ncbi:MULTISPECIES: peptidylprolyl isomerase [Leptolyngbya]|jgi:parvulin-like peptidyl-prolyl isomerase|uniref:peptidylprolyl isomerase n=1 Tax=Leptolyngbya TaxID=47251 RepID=UPI00036333E5|nr:MULTISPECIES: peptidylprolyl isomerase [Leptolyngbya]MBD2371116.1 peptidylprolyl isomerase [Leptolyngbya sp. FACHB-161]MBD2377584.1 peptidylprolyl isomerase [Leptolyngbya sp. FACHB-238]MBD2402037.1 peptidylprolyl isomerase [Leptolyngbya sp. FACHB-239]MBD2408556.1 peptidylprolyl isomerase [Leptolyngbya sp. FACHB-402]BAS60460.1 Parvulin-like peptidyl-prolyl isomerase [Leptolyngbya boryana IAM M-101]
MTLQSLQEHVGREVPALVTVNGDAFDLREALRRFMFDDVEIYFGRFIIELLVRQYALQNNLSNSTEELQVASDEFRYHLGLESVEKLRHWLRDKHQNILSLQNHLDYYLLRNKVRESIPDRDVEAYFAQHQLEFDRADLYSIRVKNQQIAEELYAKITEEDENFHLLAMQHSLDEESKPKAGYVGRMSRNEVITEIEAAVFNAQAGDIVGPTKTEQGYNLFKVGAIYPANLEAEQDTIRTLLFNKLVAKMRIESKIIYPIFEDL